eukprot:4277931-Pyramimonas_sp.AAC.1
MNNIMRTGATAVEVKFLEPFRRASRKAGGLCARLVTRTHVLGTAAMVIDCPKSAATVSIAPI